MCILLYKRLTLACSMQCFKEWLSCFGVMVQEMPRGELLAEAFMSALN
jgi:hypothetical protein